MAKNRKKASKLEAYRSKRSAQRTPEPFGGAEKSGSGLFVVQKHWARHMHFDLRLEIDGALHSWAVPRGPSLDPQEKRLAMEVEDHPLEYADFEGLIPEGNYGAGAVIVWDRGRWVPHEDPLQGLEKGKLLFDLQGYKLRGRWTLFRTRSQPNSWILMKKPDAEADAEAELAQDSILSGRTVEDLREGRDPGPVMRRKLARSTAIRGNVDPGTLEPMLAQVAAGPFSSPDWAFELKYDGYRMIASNAGGRAYLRYRGGGDATPRFPELARALTALPYTGLVLDAELVILDPQGLPSFQMLQQRAQLKHASETARARIRHPATLFVFDLLACEGFDLRRNPLNKRKEWLQQVLPSSGALRYSDHFVEQGEALFDEVRRRGLEGVMAKKLDSAYESGRSSDWLKVRADRTGDFAIVGFSPPRGQSRGIGALHIAARDDGELIYVGRVGSGLSRNQIRELENGTRSREHPPCSAAPDEASHSWVEPELICEVRYKEWTDSVRLRQPVFLRIRHDKRVEDCDLVRGGREQGPPQVNLEPAQEVDQLKLTNLDKVFWPEDGLTKGDLIDFYRAVSAWMLPFLRDRPIVLTRYPDGITGKSFFQKDAPAYVPGWLRTESMWSEQTEREIRYFICDDEQSLLYLINLGSIPLHLWAGRVTDLQHPDWCILDLDPKGAPFTDVVKIAREIRRLCESIGLACFVKTSGSSGLHVLLPLGARCTYEQARWLAELLGQVVVSRNRKIATLARSIAAREGRVYVDYLQNGHGKLLVAPFCVRPLNGAPVSTPLRWSEVNAKLDIARFHLRSVPLRLRKLRRDPWEGLLDTVPDLNRALEELKILVTDAES